MNNAQIHQQLAVRIRKVRQLEDMSQELLARRIRVSRASIVNIEQGRQGITLWRLCQIAEVLHVPPYAWLLPEDEFWRVWVAVPDSDYFRSLDGAEAEGRNGSSS